MTRLQTLSTAMAGMLALAPAAQAAWHPDRSRHPRPTTPAARVGEANRAATLEPAARAFLNAVQVFPFAEGVIYHVFTAPERVTDIELEPGEVLGSVASGDTARWVIGDTSSGEGDTKRTHILVKPFAAGLATNLVVTTDRRSYHLALTSTAATAMAALSWTYPADVLMALKKAASTALAAAPVSAPFDPAQLHFNYVLSGASPSWRPVRAFDNGRQTFVEFPASLGVGEAPPLLLVDAQGAAELVNYRVSGHFYIVDRLFDAAELRLGTKNQVVVRIDRVGDGASSSKRAAS